MNFGFLGAAAVALVTAGIHLFRGSGSVVQPLLAVPDLSAASRWMNFYTWHMASITLVVMAAGFLWAAIRPDARPAGLLLTGLAAGFFALCVYVCLRAGFPLTKVPPVMLFAAVTVLGVWGLWSARA